jgi:hypothetical protein
VVGLVGVADVEGVAVGVGVDGDGADAELLAGAQDTEGDLAAIGDQYFSKHNFLPKAYEKAPVESIDSAEASLPVGA